MQQPADRQIAMESILLATAPADVASTILDQSEARSFERGATIFLQSEPAHSVYVVLEGWVKLFRISQNGGEAIVSVMTKGQSFGEAVAFRNDAYPVTAEAATDCRLLQVRANLILTMMKSRPEVCLAMLASTYKHLHGLVAQIEQLTAQTGAQRVAEFLLELCPVEEGPCAVTLPYDKVLIAGRLGMKPESLSRAFARLRSVGVKISQNQAAISDVRRLHTYVESDRADAWNWAQ
ncbi:Crp/Fnr family transcriptional regulator [Hoeflea prorocentri]|uniref:Crp/Fnr family transcriptional regulator n=1 Tax=Hoeflea prorocentri TaxID=1922333 RepID=A0A9X3UF70_9HYPH|nr:Crp/Fnr family transcriptional regulator [Hoeflea prorocentri]MCY6380177.1 Crp/Fnr family transcriptional regulator [Hoeflea prorocentri]MDA5397977.1 Crp/Fnr family transcriptional regulator [Hoeflea prorocentri]